MDSRESRSYNSESMLVDAHLIPPVEMEVVMTGDGHVEQEYAPASPQYQYDEFIYEDADLTHFEVHNKFPVNLQHDRRDDWKADQKLKMDLYEILDAVPPHLHDKFNDFFAKRGINLDVKKSQPSSHYLFPHPVGNVPQRKKQSASAAAAAAAQMYYSDTKGFNKQRQYDYSPEPLEEQQEYVPNDSGNEEQIFRVEYSKPPENNQGASRVCTGCNLLLRRSVYYHHARMIRDRGACNLFTPQRFPCPQCPLKLGTLEKLCQHLEQIHDAPTQIKTLIFSSEEDFLHFRVELEGKGGNFRMARGNKKNKKGIVQYFRCNRLQTLAKHNTFRLVDNPSESDLPSNRRKGKLKEKVSSAKQIIRTENSCTAFYNKAYLENGTIEVRYCDHHLHDDEKLRLPEAVRLRVIELARKCLPHIVVLMIVKDERYKYCARNSANDRRILDMKPQDIRQILAGCNRQEKVRGRKGVQTRRIRIVDDGNGTLVEEEWQETRHTQTKIDRAQLTPLEERYLNLFENNRDEMLIRMQEKVKTDNEKRTLFESFIHRTASSQDLFKALDFSKLPTPTPEHYGKLEQALDYLIGIQNLLVHTRKEPRFQMQNTFLDMMEQKTRDAGRSGLSPPRQRDGIEEEDDVDVVGGVDENPYDQRVQEITREDQIYNGQEQGIEDVEEEETNYMINVEQSGELGNKEVKVEEIEVEEPIEEIGEVEAAEKKSRTGRVIKRTQKFE